MSTSRIGSPSPSRIQPTTVPAAERVPTNSSSPASLDVPVESRPITAGGTEGRRRVFGQEAQLQQQLLAQTPTATRARNLNSAVGLLNDVLKIWGGIRQSRESIQEWDGAARHVETARGQLERNPSMGILVTQTLSTGNVSVSASPVRHPSIGFDTIHPTGTSVARIWVGVNCPANLPADVKFFTPERFINAFDRL